MLADRLQIVQTHFYRFLYGDVVDDDIIMMSKILRRNHMSKYCFASNMSLFLIHRMTLH
jgi:hypothetical protein